MAEVPLTTLLSWTWTAFAIEGAALETIVSQREALAEDLHPPDGGWRAAKPYLAHTQRVLTDPTAALPWHPMVLHRGGWPDGA
jgi:hypothetical protein